MLDVDVCVVGAGPVGGTLACRLAAGGARVAVVDRAALPPMEHPDFDGRAYAVAAGSRALLEAAGVWATLPLPGLPDRGHPRLRRPDRPPRLAAVPAFRPPRGRRRAVRLDGRGAQPARGAERASARPARPCTSSPPPRPPSTRDAEGAMVQVAGGPALRCRLVVAAEGRGSPPAPAGRHRRHHACPTGSAASSAPSRTSGRTATPRSSTSCPPAPSPSCRWSASRARPTSPPSSGPSAPTSPTA